MKSENKILQCFENLPFTLKSYELIKSSDVSEDIKNIRTLKLIYETKLQEKMFRELEVNYICNLVTRKFDIYTYINNLCPEITNLDEKRFKKVKLTRIFKSVDDMKKFNPFIKISDINKKLLSTYLKNFFKCIDEKNFKDISVYIYTS